MGRIGVMVGSSDAGTAAGTLAETAASHGALVLQRHGADEYRLPHRIDHEANLQVLLDEGCDRVLAIGSVGSLKPEIPVGSLLCPDDFIALQLGISIFEDARGHRTPGFDRAWRERVLGAAEALGGESAVGRGGVYWQAIGPRFETPAEIRLLAAHADVVGMTIASECIVAGELGLPYAALCAVDNMANGIDTEPLDLGELERRREENAARLRKALETILPRL